MATTQKKTTSRGGSRSSASRGGSRAGTRSRAASAKKNTKQLPVRREMGGLALLLAALIVLVSYFTGEGWLIDRIPKICKGLFGVGYYLMVPALLAAAWVLLTHRGRPVALRVACALLMPYLFGGVCHMLFCKVDLEDAATLFPRLWETGFTLGSGGVLSGGTAHGFMAVLGKAASVIVFIVLLVAMLMVVFQVTPAMLWELWQERMAYDEDDYEDYEEPAPPPKKRAAQPRKAPARAAQRAMIDIPLDDTPLGGVKPASEEDTLQSGRKKKSFFQPREQERLTPADVAAVHREEPVIQAPAPVPEPQPAVRAVPEPAPEPVPEPEPVFEPEPVPEPEPEPEPDCRHCC